MGRRPGRLHADGQRPRVRRGQRVARAGRPLPDADLEDVHGRRARRAAAVQDWEAPPAPARPPARLYLPGNECLFRSVRDRRRGARHRAAGRRPAGRPASRNRSRRRRTAGAAAGCRPTATTAGGARARPITAPVVTRRVRDRGRHDRAARRARPAGADPVDAAGERRRRVLTGHVTLSAIAPYGARGVLTDDLLELQRLDTLADQLAHRRANLAERTAATAAADALAEHRRRRAAGAERSEELELAIDALERDGEQLAAQRARLEAQLKTVIAPREAEALMHELATIAERRDELDDQELAHLEEQSTLADAVAALDAAAARGRSGRRRRRPPRCAVAEAEVDGELGRARRRRAPSVAGRLDAGDARALRAAAGPPRRRRRRPPRGQPLRRLPPRPVDRPSSTSCGRCRPASSPTAPTAAACSSPESRRCSSGSSAPPSLTVSVRVPRPVVRLPAADRRLGPAAGRRA